MDELRFNIGDKIVGRYEVKQILRGGMGVVYLCHDYQNRIAFALKTFSDKYLANPAAKQRFIKEATTWINLGHHINIVEAERIEKIGGKPFIVLECVLDSKGTSSSLSDKLSKGSINEHTGLNIALQICLGMDYVSKKNPGLVHRDIKPSNILISHNDIAKITDFGIVEFSYVNKEQSANNARYEARGFSNQQQITQTGEIVGTPSYMSPEQYEGRPLDIRSDIYSFGCVLYEMLVGDN